MYRSLSLSLSLFACLSINLSIYSQFTFSAYSSLPIPRGVPKFGPGYFSKFSTPENDEASSVSF